MTAPDWKNAIDKVRPYIVRITTPGLSGTGFLFAYSQMLCGVATAAHVISHANWWELPIRLDHFTSGKGIILRHGQRAVLIDEVSDSASVIFPKGLIPFPPTLLDLLSEDRFLRVGNSVGWLGFPAVSPKNLCFFLGTASCWIGQEHSYLVDGVAINGVSGGPAFWAMGETPQLFGAVSAYIPNRASGEVLPGLSVVRDLKHAQNVIRQLKDIDEAKEKEAEVAPSEPPPKPPDSEL